MDFETVSGLIEDIRGLIETSLNAITQRDHELEGVFVHRDLVLDQIAALHCVVEDSFKLHAQCGDTGRGFALLQPTFLGAQLRNLHAVVQDLRSLEGPGAGAGSRKLRLQALSDSFILNIMRSLYQPAVENIDLCAEKDLDVRSLNVMKPSFVKMLMRWFLQVVESHVARNQEAAAAIDMRETSDNATTALRNEVAALRAAEAELTVKVTALESAAANLERQKLHLEGVLQASHTALGNLREEKRQLEANLKASETAARAALQALQAEVASLHAANEDCARKITAQDAQLARLREQAEARARDMGALTASLLRDAPPPGPKAGPVLRLKIVPPVKVPHRNVARGSPRVVIAGPSRATKLEGPSRAHAGVSSQELSEEEDDDDDDEDEEGSKGEGGDDEEEEENQVDEEMRGTTDALEAELLETKAKLQAALKTAARLEVELLLWRDLPTGVGGTSTQSAAPRIPPSLTSANLAAIGLLALPNRARELAQLPEVHVKIPPNLGGMNGAFNRTSIRKVLGGSVGGLFVRCTDSATPLADAHDISSFLCARMEMNPWLPAGPGRHGLLQTWFDKETELLVDGSQQHLFVGVGRWFGYCGLYHVSRVEDLTVSEWNMLPFPAKVAYADVTLAKRNLVLEGESESARLQEVFDRYEAGELRLPCVRLQCVGFDEKFYQAIVGDNRSHMYPNGAPAVSPAKSEGSRKRRRVTSYREDTQDDESE